MRIMKTTLSLFLLLMILLSGCVNRHGVSAKYYNDCKEYYDYQGYYHKECPSKDELTYKEMKEFFKKKKPEPPKGNVW